MINKSLTANIKLLLWLVILSLMLSGCSSLTSSAKGKKGPGSLSEADLTAQHEGRFAEGSIPLAEGEGVFRDIHFAFNSSEISGEAMQNIEYNAQILKEHPNLKVQLEGHCDERGTAEYNLALGADRARSVYDVLISLGIPAQRLETISYGEEVPLDPGKNEAAWAKNRRVHFSAYRPSGNS
ncbi:MAG: peptidoglycan-associated lipoprotein Pal [Candidatus Dadabacteria bacterium]|nr:MAG: peptidoglycan-associated lipoprotein Pal [Candidatus Dadabacteria bacterium]